VNTGLFGTRSSFVPLEDARLHDDVVVVPYDKDEVKDAPSIEREQELSETDEERLYRHYGRQHSRSQSDSGLPDGGRRDDQLSQPQGRGPLGEDVSGPETDEAMTRSEEEVQVGTRREETGRARLRKYVVTEEVQQTVPVTREEVRIEREPITEETRSTAVDGPAISEEEHEVTLHAGGAGRREEGRAQGAGPSRQGTGHGRARGL
jgi:stress response protein YsnF